MSTALAVDTPGAPHARPAADVLKALGADAGAGLSEDLARAARAVHGDNRLAEAPPAPWWRQLLAQFREVVVLLLLAAAAVSAALGDGVDAAAILAIVVVNALLGFAQHRKAERALAALKRLAAPSARVLRDGRPRTVPASDLVPGDLVELEAGDFVPADARLVQGHGLQAQEAALTGESAAVAKDPDAVLADDTALGDRRNMVYMGTVVTVGKASAVVVATGMKTELGRIAGLLRRTPAAPTPLERRLAGLGRFLVALCLALVLAVAGLQALRGGEPLAVFRLAVSLAVAAVPEGLPAVVTIALALGVQRMAARNALVRQLAAVETLGSVTVICSDKTGTLTRNEMTVRRVVTLSGSYDVTGEGYAPEGGFVAEAGWPADPAATPDLRQTLLVGLRCNHARVVPNPENPGGWQALGDPTEAALLVAACKARLDGGDVEVLRELPFDSRRKAMSVVAREGDGSAVMYTKGAPEVVLGMCARVLRGGRPEPLTPADRDAILAEAGRMAGEALRVLALAYRPGAEDGEEAGLVFAGLAGIIDPPRAEAKDAVATCRAAGIRPVMITGDHPGTARAIARALGLPADGDRVVTGRDLDAMDDGALARRAGDVSVYARVTAEHKLRVVRALKGNGEVVAMTGDGVNDAPAVRSADIGVAMGRAGTDVTREASALVLTDDNFATIVRAVEEGRAILANIQKFVHYLLAGNAGKILVMFVAALLGWPEPLLALQILWLNLVTDGLPALALGVERSETGHMRRGPRRPGAPLISWGRARAIVGHGVLTASAALAGFWVVYGGTGDLGHARVVAFCVAGLAQLAYALTCRSATETFYERGPLTNPHLLLAVAASAVLQVGAVTLPFLRPLFGVAAPPEPADWALIAGLALAPAVVVELSKVFSRRRGEAKHAMVVARRPDLGD